jgi:hypothetical protein
MPTTVGAITREQVEAFLIEVLGAEPVDGRDPLQGAPVFFQWARDEREIPE